MRQAPDDVSSQSREQILKIHSRKMNLMRGINLRKIAEKMPNASGAECKVTFNCVLLTLPPLQSHVDVTAGRVHGSWHVCIEREADSRDARRL
jgi:hypothetical protein